MAIDPKQLEAEANAELEKLMNPAPVEQDKPEPQPTDTADEPVAHTGAEQPPAPKDADKGFNVEESYKNLRAEYTRKAQENADLKRQLDNMQQQLSQSSQSQPTPKAEPEPDDLDSTVSEFEELSPLVKKIREQEAFIREMKASREQQTKQDYYGRIAAKHPDHSQVFQSPEFQGWMSRLTGMEARAAQLAFSEGSPDDVIAVFDRYKQSIGMGKAEQAAKLAEPTLRSRSQPQTQSPRGRFTWQQIEKMDTAEFSKNEEAINQAIASGEVI